MSITVYSKPNCVQCSATYRALDKAGLVYRTVDVALDVEALEQVRALGYTVPFAVLAITYLASNTVGSIVPSPGGIGPVELALTAGLVAAGLHPNPVPHADVVSTTVHKTLGGPRSGMLLSSRAEQWGKKLNSAVFPGQQGGPLMHVIAAKAIAMKVAQTEEFKDRQRRTLEGAQILAERLGADDAKNAGIKLVTGGTDVHLVLVDLVDSQINGKQAEDLLHEVGAVHEGDLAALPRQAQRHLGREAGGDQRAVAEHQHGLCERDRVAAAHGRARHQLDALLAEQAGIAQRAAVGREPDPQATPDQFHGERFGREQMAAGSAGRQQNQGRIVHSFQITDAAVTVTYA